MLLWVVGMQLEWFRAFGWAVQESYLLKLAKGNAQVQKMHSGRETDVQRRRPTPSSYALFIIMWNAARWTANVQRINIFHQHDRSRRIIIHESARGWHAFVSMLRCTCCAVSSTSFEALVSPQDLAAKDLPRKTSCWGPRWPVANFEVVYMHPKPFGLHSRGVLLGSGSS